MTHTEQLRCAEEELKPVSWHFYNTCNNYPHNIAQKFNPELYNNDNNGQFKWFELLDRVEKIACGLMLLGIKPKELVGLMAQSGPYWTQVDMALCCLGCVSVTLFPALSLREASYILNDSGSRCLIVGDQDILDRIIKGYNNITKLEKIIVLDLNYTSRDKRITGLKELLELGEKFKIDKYAEYIECKESISINDWYSVIYTSGTSGAPRGTVISHANIVNKINGANKFWRRYNMTITDNDTTLCYLPLCHIFDRAACQLSAIFNGAAITYADSTGTVLDDIKKYNPTWFNSVPILYEKIYIHFRNKLEQNRLRKFLYKWATDTAYEALAYRREKTGAFNMDKEFDLVSRLPLFLRLKYRIAYKFFNDIRNIFGKEIRFIFLAAPGLSPSLLTFFYSIGIPVVEGYGSTESISACLLNPLTACKPGFVGINTDGNSSRIAADGELEITGASVFTQYLYKPEMTVESFTDDGWYKTGDIVTADEYGYFRILDRKKAIICTSIGKNIAPAKLKGEFKSSDYVDQIFFVGDDKNYIAALIVPNFNYFIDLYEKEGIRYNKSQIVWDDSFGMSICIKVGDDFIRMQRINQLIKDAVDKANKNLENFEKIKQYALLSERFSEQNGTMTPTHKMKKDAIIKKYSDVIEKMYN